MRARRTARSGGFGGACAVALALAAPACGASDRDLEASEAFFGPKGVLSIDLRLDPGAMAELSREPRDWVRGSVVLGEKDDRVQHDDVALRFKGHRSLRTWASKPAFKLDFTKHEKDRRVHGMEGLVLNNMVEDPTMLRERLASELYAALGVPASRVGFAEVSVNGQRFGLYSVLEPIDGTFLERVFGTRSGPVYEGDYGCDVYESDVWGFGHEAGDDPQRAALAAFARAVSGKPAQWLFGDKPVIAPGVLLRFLAAGALIGDFDGYRHAHNYRIYRHPKTVQWHMIPWGFDRVLKSRLDIYDSHGRLAQACFRDAACRVEFVKVMGETVRRFEAYGLPKRLEREQRRIAAFVARDKREPHGDDKRDEALAGLRRFLRERPAEVRAQLACWDGKQELDRDRDGAGCMDCDDADPARGPHAVEVCNGRDDDCNGHVDDAPSCPCQVTELVGDTAYELCDLRMSYWDAKAFCAARGRSLARIDEKATAKQLARAAHALRGSDFWVGLDDLEHEGRYRYADGERVARGLWAKGEPDHYSCGQNCAALKDDGGGKLRDLHCATPNPFICSGPAPQDTGRSEPNASPTSQEKSQTSPAREGSPTAAP
jgi:hypothetical protein